MDYKVCGLARLTLYENPIIEEEKKRPLSTLTGQSVKWVEEKN